MKGLYMDRMYYYNYLKDYADLTELEPTEEEKEAEATYQKEMEIYQKFTDWSASDDIDYD